MLKCKGVGTPMTATEKLSKGGTLLSADEATNYRSMAGGLQYLTITRLEISFAVNKICQLTSLPR
jgi:hypothetical protein